MVTIEGEHRNHAHTRIPTFGIIPPAVLVPLTTKFLSKEDTLVLEEVFKSSKSKDLVEYQTEFIDGLKFKLVIVSLTLPVPCLTDLLTNEDILNFSHVLEQSDSKQTQKYKAALNNKVKNHKAMSNLYWRSYVS